MDQTPNLQLPYLMAAQSQKHVTHNEAIRMLDALLQAGAASRTVSAPPASPSDGVRYILPAGATGVWAGAAGRIAAFQDGAWAYFTPREGWIVWLSDEQKAVVFAAGAWTLLPGAPVSSFPTLGVNATADTTNRLAVSAPASLFNHAGGGHQLKLNKAAAAATASLLYQTGFSGRAEMGLTGDDDFHVKVSPDGSTWRDAVLVSAATGKATFPAGGIVTSSAATVTIAVPAQAASIQAALDQFMSYRFEGTAQGVVSVANGTYSLATPLTCRHPQPGRIVVRAATAATLPVEADFTGTKATDEAMLRAKFKVIVEGLNAAVLSCSDGEGIGLVQDIAFIRTGTAGTPVGVAAARRAGIVLDRCAVSGFTNNLAAREQGQITATNCAFVFSAAGGVLLVQGGAVRVTAALILSSGTNGIEASHSLFVSDAGLRVKGSAGAGLSLASGSRALIAGGNFAGNTGPSATLAGACLLDAAASTFAGGTGQNSVLAVDGSTALLSAITTSGDATQRAFTAQRASILSTSGTHSGPPVFSPAPGTTANNGAWSF